MIQVHVWCNDAAVPRLTGASGFLHGFLMSGTGTSLPGALLRCKAVRGETDGAGRGAGASACVRMATAGCSGVQCIGA